VKAEHSDGATKISVGRGAVASIAP